MVNFITTNSKIRFTPTTPNAEDINIEDIAHALSFMCRANGHFRSFYSVGQHSINCALEAKARGYTQKVQLACLLHDGSEAYLADVTRPVKACLPAYFEFEDTLQNMIWDKYLEAPLTKEEYELVFEVDDCLLHHEFKNLLDEDIFETSPTLFSTPNFEFVSFENTKQELLSLFNGKEIKTSSFNKKYISEIEYKLVGKTLDDVQSLLLEENISYLLFEKNVRLKKLAGQVNVVIHSIGILLSLAKILKDGEVIEYLSLGAGNTGKDFDLETNFRVAEYKFIDWADKSNTIRENNIFKDFYELSIYDTNKEKYIYCYNLDIVKKFFNASRSLDSVLSKGSLKKAFFEKFGGKYTTVKDFYYDFKDDITFVDLKAIL